MERDSWRGIGRRAVVGVATGVLLVSTAWAGAGLAPGGGLGGVFERAGSTAVAADDAGTRSGRLGPPATPPGRPDGVPGRSDPLPGRPGGPGGGDGVEPTDPDGAAGPAVPDGVAVARAGAARVDLEPVPPEGRTWRTDRADCELTDPSVLGRVPGSLESLLSRQGTPWPVGEDCLYLGGYGFGPMNPMTSVDDDLGLSARAVSIGSADGDTLVVVSVDAIGWPYERVHTCLECGAKAIGERLGEELGIDPAGIWIHGTHSHTSPDAMGVWGGVPEWYLQQMTTGIEDAIRTAVTGAHPVVLERAEVIAREHNRERRSTYASSEEAHLGVLRALAVTDDGRFVVDGGGTPQVVATLGAYAAHPTTRDAGSGVAHPDWAGVFERAVDARDGGRTVQVQTGLGNLSTRGGTDMGSALADRVPQPGQGTLLRDATVRVAGTEVLHPVSNLPLTALGVPGFIDREFTMRPSTARAGTDEAPCVSAGPASVRTPLAAARIGDEVSLTAAPGELFSNLSNTLKENSGTVLTLPLSQINDALGYIIQSFELDRISTQGLGFLADGAIFVDYEDSYAIDACFGDVVLEESLTLLDGLAADGS